MPRSSLTHPPAPGPLAHLQARGRPPGLALIQVGDQSDSAIYVRSKHKACEEAGIASFAHTPPDTVTPRSPSSVS